MSNSSNLKNQIDTLFISLQEMIDDTNTSNNASIRDSLDKLRDLLEEYNLASPTENNVANNLNFALSKQSMTIEEREELLNTKLRQIEIATERNSQTTNMLTIFIIINIVVLLTFIGLIIMKTD
jgi:hypothetical protein